MKQALVSAAFLALSLVGMLYTFGSRDKQRLLFHKAELCLFGQALPLYLQQKGRSCSSAVKKTVFQGERRDCVLHYFILLGNLGLGQMPKQVYWAHVGTAGDRTQWRADVRRKGRTTTVQIEELSCGGTL